MFRNATCARIETRLPALLAIPALLAALVASLPALAAEHGGTPVDLTGRLTTILAHRIGAPEGLSQRDLLFDLTASYEWGDRWRIRALARFRTEDRLEPETRTEIDVRELVLTRRSRDTTLKLGRQQVVWGKADGIRLLDAVNPLDLREFLLEDFSDSRIPLWMVNAEVFRGDSAFQLLIIPDLAFDRVPPPGAELFPFPELLSLPVPVQVDELEKPADNPGNWEYGFRWSGQVGRLDLTANALYGWNNEPVLEHRLTPSALELRPEAGRSRILGASGDLPLGPTVLRFEATWTPDDPQPVLSDDGLGSFRRQRVWRHVVGLDWIRSNWLISPQWFEQRVIDPDPDLTGEGRRTFLSLLVRRAFQQERLLFQTFYVYGFEDRDQWLSPNLSYRFFGRLEVGLGADLLGGRPSGVFGRFSSRDRITFETTVRF